MNIAQRTFVGIAILLLALSLFWGGDRFSMTPFREAQTAITSYYMATGDSPFLAYEVPVLGREWAVPLEFPIFQWIVAKLSPPDIHQIRWTGRVLSLVFWLACLWVTHQILKAAPLDKGDRLWTLILLALSPIFVAYSATFLIESLALLLALIYLWCTIKGLQNRNRLHWVIIGILPGILAALTKPTTWAPFAGVVALAVLFKFVSEVKSKSEQKAWLYPILAGAVLVLLPMIAALQWVHFGDEVKMLNPLAQNLISDNLSAWNYGTLAQKLSPRVWSIVLGKQFLLLFGPLCLLAVPLVIMGFFHKLNWKQPSIRCIWIVLAAAGYGSAPIVFTNLHFRHDYYLFANGLFLILAFSLSLSALREKWPARRLNWIWGLVCFSAAVTSLGYMGVRKMFQEPADDRVIEVLRELPEQGPVIFLGFGWSSNMPYFAERRALMTGKLDPESDRYADVIRNNQQEPWAAIITASPEYAQTAVLMNEAFQLNLNNHTELWPGITLYSRSEIVTNAGSESENLLASLEARIPRSPLPESNLLLIHSPLSKKPNSESWLEVMFRRGSELYVFDGGRMSFTRFKGYFVSED